MKPRAFRGLASALVLFLGLAGTGLSQLPVARLSQLIPAGGRVGATTRVRAVGRDLEGVHSLSFSTERIEVESVVDEAGVFDVRIPEDLIPGYYEARVVGKYGVSNPRVFEVGTLEEIAAVDGRHERAGAQEIAIGQTVNAQAVESAFDYYRFTAKAGSQVVIRVTSTSIHSRMRPAIAIRQGNRELLSSRIRERIVFRPLEDGDYELWISDHIFRGGAEYFYRLSVSDGMEIRSVYPPLEELPGKEAYEVYGWNLDDAEPVANGALFRLLIGGDAMRSESAEGMRLGARRPSSLGVPPPSRVWSLENGASMSRSPLYPTSDSTAFENESLDVHPLEIPATVAGRFYPPKDHDLYEFLAIENEDLWIEVEAERFGEPVKPFGLIQRVESEGSGEKLIDIEQLTGKASAVGGVAFDMSSTDISQRFSVPRSGRYRVTLWDLFNTSRVDPGLSYRIYIGPARPNFSIVALAQPPQIEEGQRAAATWGHFLRKGEVVPIRVLALREHGFNGAIRLTCPDTPEGVGCSPTVIGAGETEARVFAHAATDAPGWTGRLTLRGVAEIDGKEVSMSAKSGVVVWDVADARNEQVISEWNPDVYLGVSDTEVAPVRIERVDPETPVEVVAGDSKKLEFDVFRRDGLEIALEISIAGDPAVEKLDAVAVPADESKLEVEIDTAKLEWKPGRYSIHLESKPGISYAKEGRDPAEVIYGLYSKPLVVEVRPEAD